MVFHDIIKADTLRNTFDFECFFISFSRKDEHLLEEQSSYLNLPEAALAFLVLFHFVEAAQHKNELDNYVSKFFLECFLVNILTVVLLH